MKVLLATDASEQAVVAADFLNSLSLAQPIELTLITALGDPYGASPESTQHWFPELLRQERTRAESHQSAIAERLKDRCKWINQLCRPGHPTKVVLATAAELESDLIVLGAQGHSFFSRLLLGSISDSIATHAKCSVLVVRPPQKPPAADESKSNAATRLLIGFDGSYASRQAGEEIAGLQWREGTAVELISVAPIYDYLLGTGLSTAAIVNEEEIAKEMRRSGQEMREQMAKSIPNTSSIIVHEQRIGPAITDLAGKEGFDLVVVGDSGHSLLDDFLLGSTCKYVLRHAPCSVWISRHHRRD